jgi:putative hydrolase of the HAD superfamily
VTFDAAGTLFEVAEPVGRTYARIAARHGISLAAAEVEERFRAALATAPPLAFPRAEPQTLAECERGWWKVIVAQAFGPGRHAPGFDACFAELFAHYAAPAAWRVYADVVPVLTRLRHAGLRLAVVSNFDRRLLDILAGLGLGSFFDEVLPSAVAGAAKPDPAIFRRVLASLAVDAAATVHVGDGMREDVEGARAAGLGAVLLDRSARRPAVPSGARTVVTLAGLPALLDDFGRRSQP